MGFFQKLIDIFLHLDVRLSEVIVEYGVWTYLILFLIIFIETGLVIMPFLPGDSLLFAAGAFAAKGDFNIFLIFGLLFLAAVLGDTLNYAFGKYLGPKVFVREYRFLKKEYLFRTQHFYEKHGGKAIVLARFIPIVRTFAPFVAGIGSMNYKKFISYNIWGGLVWVALFLSAGYFFGNIPFVKKNFSLVILLIIFVSVIPPIFEAVKQRINKKKAMKN